MATRLYMSSTQPAPVVVAQHANWERVIAAATSLRLSTSKQDSALTDFAALQGGTTTGQTRWMTFVSHTIAIDTSISGTCSIVVRGLEGAANEDAHLAFAARVMDTTGTTERGLLLFQGAAATEFTTSAETRIFSAVAIATVAALAGDRIVLEVGIHGVTPANGANVTLRFGDPAATADFALTSGLTTDLVPWFELSTTLTFSPAPPPPNTNARRALLIR